jgi:hypothetical protein
MATASASQASAVPEKKKKPSALRSILAGSTAGAVEIGTHGMISLALMSW